MPGLAQPALAVAREAVERQQVLAERLSAVALRPARLAVVHRRARLVAARRARESRPQRRETAQRPALRAQRDRRRRLVGMSAIRILRSVRTIPLRPHRVDRMLNQSRKGRSATRIQTTSTQGYLPVIRNSAASLISELS